MRRFWASAGALSVLVSCASSPTVPSGDPVAEFELAAGESAAVSGTGLTVRFDRVVSDSRCPANALCITAGDAEIAVSVRRAGRPATGLSLRTLEGGNRVALGDWLLSFTQLSPYPFTDSPIAPGEYRATFRVDPVAQPARR